MGTRVCEEALQTGLAVVSINRSGAPKATASWTSEVDWISVSSKPPARAIASHQHSRHATVSWLPPLMRSSLVHAEMLLINVINDKCANHA